MLRTIVDPHSRSRLWLASACIAVCLAACAGTDSERDGAGGSSETSAPTAQPKGKDGTPATTPAVDVGTPGALNRPGPSEPAWTPQETADAILQAKIVYEDGTVHDPADVSCEGEPTSASNDGASFETLRCTVQVPDVAPYKVVVNVEEAGEAELKVAGPAG